MTIRTGRIALIASHGLIAGILAACAVGYVGDGYDTGGVGYVGGYYEPYGYEVGGWAPGYHVGPGRPGMRRGAGGTHSYHAAPPSRPTPSLPGRSRKH